MWFLLVSFPLGLGPAAHRTIGERLQIQSKRPPTSTYTYAGTDDGRPCQFPSADGGSIRRVEVNQRTAVANCMTQCVGEERHKIRLRLKNA